MSRETLNATDLRALHRRVAMGVAILWCLGTLGLFATVVVLGEVKHVAGTDMPPVLNNLTMWVFLFPGLHAAGGLAQWLGVRPADGWVNLSIFLTAIVISSVFWVGLIPWVVVGLRAYVWPWRITVHAADHAESSELKSDADQR
jgi:hypothetical protein